MSMLLRRKVLLLWVSEIFCFFLCCIQPNCPKADCRCRNRTLVGNDVRAMQQSNLKAWSCISSKVLLFLSCLGKKWCTCPTWRKIWARIKKVKPVRHSKYLMIVAHVKGEVSYERGDISDGVTYFAIGHGGEWIRVGVHASFSFDIDKRCPMSFFTREGGGGESWLSVFLFASVI